MGQANKTAQCFRFVAKQCLRVLAGTQYTVTSYIDPTWDLATFCMWTACKGRFVAYDSNILHDSNREVVHNMFFDSFIKRNELYETVEKHVEVQ